MISRSALSAPARMAALFGLILATSSTAPAFGNAAARVDQSETAEAPAASTDTDPAQPCFDIAVVASAPRYRWLPVDDGEGIIIRAPVLITFDVEEVMAGRLTAATVTVRTALHTTYNRRDRYFLLYLKHDKAGRERLASMGGNVLRGTDGDFVIPVTGPYDPADTVSDRYIPPDYEKLVRPIRYRSSDAWWLRSSELERRPDGSVATEAYPWGVMKKDGIVAPRGIKVENLVEALSPRRCS
jgi:hypothetical protein